MRIWYRVVAFTVTVAVLVGCGPMMPSSVASYAGSYRAASTRTQVNLEVKADSFTAVTVTEPQAPGTTVQANSVQRANANSAPTAVWVIFAGDVTSSVSGVIVRIADVERDGQALEGGELEAYTDCEVTATAGDGFGDAVMVGIFECLGATDVEIDSITVSPYDEQDPPSKLIIGAWKHDDPDLVGQVVERMVISANAYELDLNSGVERCHAYMGDCIVVRSAKFHIDDIDDWKITRGPLLEGVAEREDVTRFLFDDTFYVGDSNVLHYTIDVTGDDMSIRTDFGSAKLRRIR